jgi:hypothetical protein
MSLQLPDELAARIIEEAKRLHVTPQQRLSELLDGRVAPASNFPPGVLELGLQRLRDVLGRIPHVVILQTSLPTEPLFWVKFKVDLSAPIAWNIVQELSFVLNDISTDDRLPTLFKPVSPPPYLNGGPEEYLAWMVESRIEFQDAGQIATMLENRLPKPIENADAWVTRPEDIPGGKDE